MPKTNKERLQDNNIELQNIKTGIDNLPEYQDIKPIYATGDLINYAQFVSSVSFPKSVKNVSYKGNYLVGTADSLNPMGSYSDRYCIADITAGALYTLADRVYSTTEERRASIVGETDDCVFIARPSKPDSPTTIMEIYKYNKTTHNVTTKTQNLGSNMNVYINTRMGYDEYIYMARTYYMQLKFNTSTELFEFISTPFSFSTQLDDVNKLYSITYESFRSGTSATLYRWSDVKHTSYVNKTISYLSGVNWDGTKVFQNGNVYVLNQDMSVGELLKSNSYSYVANKNLYCLNDKYYLYNNKLYSFDENTNELSLIDSSNSYYLADAGKIFKKSGNTTYLYDFNNTDTVIGFEYNGVPYINSTNNIFSENKVLINNSFVDASGNIISGTMPNNGALNYTPTTSRQTIPAGYTSGGIVEAIDYSGQGALSPQDTATAEAQIEDLFGEGE